MREMIEVGYQTFVADSLPVKVVTVRPPGRLVQIDR